MGLSVSTCDSGSTNERVNEFKSTISFFLFVFLENSSLKAWCLLKEMGDWTWSAWNITKSIDIGWSSSPLWWIMQWSRIEMQSVGGGGWEAIPHPLHLSTLCRMFWYSLCIYESEYWIKVLLSIIFVVSHQKTFLMTMLLMNWWPGNRKSNLCKQTWKLRFARWQQTVLCMNSLLSLPVALGKFEPHMQKVFFGGGGGLFDFCAVLQALEGYIHYSVLFST